MESGSLKATINMLGPIAWLALAAGLQMLGALLFFRAPVDLILIFTGAAITFSVYLLNRFTDNEDSYNYPEQKMFFQQKPALIGIPILLIAISFFLLAISGRLVTWHVILIIFGILYSVSVIPFVRNKSLCFVRLKDILFVKNLAVSLLWGITPFALAASQKFSVMPAKFDLFVVATAFCLTSLINTASCDVRDVEGDRHAGVLTLATRFGQKFTAIFLLSLGAIGCCVVEINYLSGNVSRTAAILFFINIAWTGVVAAPLYLKYLKLPKSYSEPLIDSQFVMNGLSLIVLALYV
jgi:4-hydroxybenzoate polyprenyltransferase